MSKAPTKRPPAHKLPALQRPTPSRCIRLHLDTHAELSRMKRPGQSYDALVLLLMACWNTHIGPRPRLEEAS